MFFSINILSIFYSIFILIKDFLGELKADGIQIIACYKEKKAGGDASR
jgi:hypothetical protein